MRWEKPQVLRVIANWLAVPPKLRPFLAVSDVFLCTPSPLNITALFTLEAAALPMKTDLGKCFMEYISALHLINLNLLVGDSTPEPCCCEPGRPRVSRLETRSQSCCTPVLARVKKRLAAKFSLKTQYPDALDE